MTHQKIDALGRAREMVEEMQPGLQRQEAAALITYRLMMRGDCSRALPMMTAELLHTTSAKVLDGLTTGALVGRDPRCMKWVAERLDVYLAQANVEEDQRAALRLRGQTMFMLVGQLARSYGMPSANFEALDDIPDSLANRKVELEGLTLHIQMGDTPTRRETMLLTRLWDYRGTALQIRLARALEQRASAEPKFLTSAGWIEVALVLLAAGNRQGAEQLLAKTSIRYMTLAGLDAEAAIRTGDFGQAASIMATNEWGTKAKSVYWIMRYRPQVLSIYIDGQRLFGTGPDASLGMVSLSEALDRAGSTADAERAAKVATAFYKDRRYGSNRIAQALARLGQFEEARDILLKAESNPDDVAPGHVRIGIAVGAALGGNLLETVRTIETAPAAERDRILVKALAAVSRVPSHVRDDLEERLIRRADQKSLQVSSDDFTEFVGGFVGGGLAPSMLNSLLVALPKSRKNAEAVGRMAEAAGQFGRLDTSLMLAEAAEARLPDGPEADQEIVPLAAVYWKLSRPDKAKALVKRMSHPVGKVEVLARALDPMVGDSQPQLSFITNF